MDTIRFVVVEDDPGAADAELLRLRGAGLEVAWGFRGVDPRTPSATRVGRVADERDAADAVLAAIAGARLVIETTAGRSTIDRLIDDLQRLGPVEHRVGRTPVGPDLPTEARALLGLIAEGYSLGDAAELLGLARRTADRRLAAARRALGTRRTTEAIARARRLGWLSPPDTH